MRTPYERTLLRYRMPFQNDTNREDCESDIRIAFGWGMHSALCILTATTLLMGDRFAAG
jgi:hypothetical protein